MSSELKTNKISPATGTALQISDSGDTTTIPSGATLSIASGATITNSGTATGFGDVLTDFCRISAQSTFTSLIHNTMTTLAFDTEDWDVHGSMANLSNNRIDIKNAGYYVVGARLNINSGTGNESRYVWVNLYDDSASATVDGIAKQNIQQTSHSGAQFLSCMSIYYFSVDDYLTLQGFTNAGGTPTEYALYCGRIK
tara:strand:+ start:127 stop:717 length:591 start_codon:yes stop_codon:yes gene_type:complete